MNILIIIISLTVIITAACSGIAYYLVYFILDRNSPHKEGTDSLSKDPEEVKHALAILRGSDEWREFFYENAQEIHITSHDNIDLCGYFLRSDSDIYAILCHGYTSYHAGMMGKAEYLYKKGYSVLLPDARAHGKSEGRYRGMGWPERKDLMLWINEILKENSSARIILSGQSMGGATVLNSAGENLPDNVKLVISDCAYTGVWEEFSLQLRVRYHLPAFPVMHIANIISRHKAGFSFREASPLRQVRKCTLPVLFIHGKNDDFVPFYFMQQLYDAAGGPKQMLGIDGAGHCMAEAKNTELYRSTVDKFIEKYI